LGKHAASAERASERTPWPCLRAYLRPCRGTCRARTGAAGGPSTDSSNHCSSSLPQNRWSGKWVCCPSRVASQRTLEWPPRFDIYNQRVSKAVKNSHPGESTYLLLFCQCRLTSPSRHCRCVSTCKPRRPAAQSSPPSAATHR
jgi:hypothetical protein